MTATNDESDAAHKPSNKWLLWLVLLGSLGYGGYSAFEAYRSEALDVEIRPIRKGADAGVAALVLVTNTGSTPVLLRQVAVNGRTATDCVVKANKSLRQGDSFEASPNMLLGFYSASCGRIQKVQVTTDGGSSEYSIRW